MTAALNTSGCLLNSRVFNNIPLRLSHHFDVDRNLANGNPTSLAAATTPTLSSDFSYSRKQLFALVLVQLPNPIR